MIVIANQWNRIKQNLTVGQAAFFATLLLFIIFTPSMIKSVDNVSRIRQIQMPDYGYPCWADFAMMLYIMPVFTITKYLIKKHTQPFFVKKLSIKYSGEVLKLKLEKCSKNCFKIFYFAFITALGFYVYSDTEYHSPIMFGSGESKLMFSDWPFDKIPRLMKFYYMVGMSYHVEDSLHHLIHPAQSDFYEMLLHHYITVILIVGSFMSGCWNGGLNVMIQMDNGDIFVGLIRSVMDFAPVPVILILYLCCLFSWIYFRLYAFAMETLGIACLSSRRYMGENDLAINVGQLMLFGLFVLNIYWTVLFLRMGFRLV
jgi:hypothetical protein